MLKNDNKNILFGISVQINHKLEHNKPDILIADKHITECHIIDVVFPFNTRVKEKEQEKVERYHELKRETGRFWQCRKVVVISIMSCKGLECLKLCVTTCYPRFSNHLNKVNKMRYKTVNVMIKISAGGSYFKFLQLGNLYAG